MPIESKCPGCGRTLRIADEHAGKQARCPMCNEIYQVALDTAGANSTFGGGPWRMRTPEGHTYGPVDKSELDAWVAEGRVTAECQLSADENPAWMSADEVYQTLRPKPQPGPVANRPTTRYLAPHRGGMILAMGIISWAVGCPIFGICAWVMGNTDLNEMRAGRMDQRGMGLTQAGQVVGMIHALISIFVIVLFVFLFLLGVGWR